MQVQIDLDEIHLSRYDAWSESTKNIRSFRIERHRRGNAPPTHLRLNLWQPDAEPTELPETLKGLEFYPYSSGLNVKCSFVLHSRRDIEALRRIEEDLLVKLAAEMGLTIEDLRKAYGHMDWGQLLQSKMIRGTPKTIMAIDMSNIKEARRITYTEGEGYRASKTEAATIADIATGQRVFPCVHIKSIECYAQTIKFGLAAHRVDILHEDPEGEASL